MCEELKIKKKKKGDDYINWLLFNLVKNHSNLLTSWRTGTLVFYIYIYFRYMYTYVFDSHFLQCGRFRSATSTTTTTRFPTRHKDGWTLEWESETFHVGFLRGQLSEITYMYNWYIYIRINIYLFCINSHLFSTPKRILCSEKKNKNLLIILMKFAND